ncbi:MAG: SDR family oxidoreductase [Polyangiales bacterium]|nr:SDR family oxidoreductase [Myxococcales bacterium]MCB9660643.1 SDR family oxidoreductase [Sandaracinaceae bacterium]
MPTPAPRDTVALVTGAASGLGAALTRALLAQGAFVLALDLDATALDAQHTDDPRLVKRAHDVRDRADAAEAVRVSVARWGRLDLAIHNAGVVGGGRFEECNPTDSDRILDVNLRGVLHGTEAAYAQMVQQRSGQIVNVSSMAGLHPVAFSTVYTASKHAVLGLSLALREESRQHGVGVSVACPGLIRTGIFGAARDAHGYSYGERVQGVPGTPLSPEAAAAAVLAGARRDDPLIVFPRSSRALALAARVAPGALRWAVGRTMRPPA